MPKTPLGSKGELTIIRDGKKISKTVEIGELQDEEGAAPAEDTGSDDLGMDLADMTEALARRYAIEETAGVLALITKPYSSMPDGSTYFCFARVISLPSAGSLVRLG